MSSYAEVIPRVKISRRFVFFDYTFSSKQAPTLAPGSLVTVSFRGRDVPGVVSRIKKHSTYHEAKEIGSVLNISLAPGLVRSLVDLAQWYAVSPSLLVSLCLPETVFPAHAAFPKPSLGGQPLPFSRGSLHDVVSAVTSVSQSQEKLSLFSYRSDQERILFYLSLIKKYQSLKKTIAFIVPTVQDTVLFSQYLSPSWQTEALLWHHLSPTARFSAFRAVVSSGVRIIIGTQGAAWLPYPGGTLVVVDQEHDRNHRQSDHNPRFDVKKVMEVRAKREDLSVIFTSHAPLVTTLHRNVHALYRIPSSSFTVQRSKTHLVDLSDELQAPKFHFFTERSKQTVASALERGERVFLFFNRLGFSRRFFCNDCGLVIQCDRCHIPFFVQQKEKGTVQNLQCSSCGKTSSLLASCPSCKGSRMTTKGFGIQRVHEEIEKHFSGISILRLDKDSGGYDDGHTPVVLGTQFALRKIRWSTFSTVLILFADDTGFATRFWRSTEEWYHVLSEMLFLSDSYRVRDIFFQTFHPESWWMQLLLARNHMGFFQKELSFRKEFSYPPFISLFRFLCYHTTEEGALEVQKTVEKFLNGVIDRDMDTLFLSPSVVKKGKKYYAFLFLKKRSKKKIDFLQLPDQCFLERDPDILL